MRIILKAFMVISFITASANCFAVEKPSAEINERPNFIITNIPKASKGHGDNRLDETLNNKLKIYEKNRSNRSYADKFGVSIDKDVSTFYGDSRNPALEEQIKKSDDFKKIYTGPKEANKNNKNMGFKLSIPLERDKK